MKLETIFTKEEKYRQEYMRQVEALSLPTFDPDRWEKLRKLVYKPRQLTVDVIIDDTTLREGLQMARLVSPPPKDRCKIACMLRDIGIERLEVITYTPSDKEAVRLMQDEGLGDMLAAWCRAAIEDVDLALKLDFKQVGISHPVSYIHFKKWPDMPLEKLVERVAKAVTYARDHGLRVFVHGEDATRADWNFERAFINAVSDAGAEVYRICDTVGCGLSDPDAPLPLGIPAKVRHIKEETRIPYIEIHAHDDIGNAVENTMATIKAANGLHDKVYVSTTFLGIGERAGNAETEKVIMNCYMHYGIKKWNLNLLRETANFLASSLSYHLPTNKAIVGDLAFSHESGIHVHGIEVLPLTYEMFPPELVGHKREIIIGKRSGKHAIRLKVEEILGRKVDEDDPRLIRLTEMIRDKYVSEKRKYPMKEEELEEAIRKVGFQI